ncbi:hypothetical protein ACFWXH_04430 [Mesorhizobium sp. NPDC059054]|uniref:hypothetical protein n=1 Tax=Mesorhizobium sp. NPDC059054 TaxID=3346711 RepID=UPI003674EE38
MSHTASRFAQMTRWVRHLKTRYRRQRRKASTPEDADAQWREMAENDLYGANTPDYTHVPKESARSDHPVSPKPSQ